MVHRALIPVTLLASGLTAQTHIAGALGSVHFVTSCSPAVAPQFDRAVALLHSFEFGAAIKAFTDVRAADSTCAMADWGIALSRWGNPMSAGNRPPAALAAGRDAANAAGRLAAGASDRERDYVAAVAELFGDVEHRDQRVRVLAYEAATKALAARFPADTEAQIFHAIALVAAAPPTDKTFVKQREAGVILEGIWVKQPDHPGLAHYIIHAYDIPALAPQARAAAERYAGIAPGAAHALHMPSHTFTRLGMWRESIATNLRSIAQASKNGSIAEVLHASDYAVYAYLQLQQNAAAKKIIDGLPVLAARFDPAAVTGAAPGSAGVFALAAMPARYALERRDWKMAASLRPAATAFPYAEAMTYLARGLGAAHTGNLGDAGGCIDSLGAIHARLVSQGEAYWAEQVAIEQLEARTWWHFASGRTDSGLVAMHDAIVREDATEKNAVTPGPLASAHELMGDLLMELKRPREALVEYRATLVKEPNRYRAVHGAAIALRAIH